MFLAFKKNRANSSPHGPSSLIELATIQAHIQGFKLAHPSI